MQRILLMACVLDSVDLQLNQWKHTFWLQRLELRSVVLGEEEKDAGRGVIPLQKVSRERKRKRTLLSNYPMLPWWLSSKESVCNAGNLGLVPGSGRSPGGENDNPLQYFCLGNPMDREVWWGYSPWVHKRVQHNLATKQQPCAQHQKVFSFSIQKISVRRESHPIL